jgi:large subunit ribosomal protein L6
MSRVGKKPVPVPSGVDVKISEDWLEVKGPKGTLRERMHPAIKVEFEDGRLSFARVRDDKADNAAFGLLRSLASNMVTGVTEGFQKGLEIVGIGYRAEVKGKTLVLNLGFSNPIEYAIPEGVEIAVEQKNKVVVRGVDKQLIGSVAAKIRGFRPPEPYKGKGVKYLDEQIRRKVGKTGA